MNVFAVFFTIIVAAFLLLLSIYIIQIDRVIAHGFGFIAGRGVEGWRGFVRGRFRRRGAFEQGGGGVGGEDRGGFDGEGFGEFAALNRGAQGLAGYAERSGAAGGAGVAVEQGGKSCNQHGGPRVRRARRMVVWSPSFKRLERATCLRQRVVDARGFFKSRFIAPASSF